MHGSNRLGGNSLSDLLVFGRRAGLHAAEAANGLTAEPAVDRNEVERLAAEAIEAFGEHGTENPYALQGDLQDTMQSLVGIIRREDELRKALGELDTLEDRAGRLRVEGNRYFNPGWHLALDLPSLLTVARCTTLAALERKESRGGHTRDDFPGPDPAFGTVNVVVGRDPATGEVTVRQEPLPQMPDDLKALFDEQKG
jgi:succinate dehydrogenase / fumarate reductase flavoprotein subunit